MGQSEKVSEVPIIDAPKMTRNMTRVVGMRRLLPHDANFIVTIGLVCYIIGKSHGLLHSIVSVGFMEQLLLQVLYYWTDNIEQFLTRRVFINTVRWVMQTHLYGQMRVRKDDDGLKSAIHRCEQCTKDIISMILVVKEKQTLSLLDLTN